MLATAAVATAARVIYRRHPQRDIIALMAALTVATLPPAVQLTFHVFRANTLPLTPMLALTALVLAWRTGRWLPAILTGIFMGFAAMVYSGGIFVPAGLGLVAFVELWRGKGFWRRFQQGLVMVVSFAITMLPWLYFYVTVGGWTHRIQFLSDGPSPLSDPNLFWENTIITISLLFAPNLAHDLRYMPYTTGFLNPALIVLFLVGIAVTLWHWRKAWSLAPLLLGMVLLLPDILSSEPYQPVRLVGLFGALGLLVGLGAGEIVRWTTDYKLAKRGVLAILLAITIATPLWTSSQVWYHYREQPYIGNPHTIPSVARHYRIGFMDMLVDSATHSEPTYMPLMHLNTDLAIVALRPRLLPHVVPYDGRPLPAGRMILPLNGLTYGFFPYEQTPVQYGLILPETGEIMVLPPLDLDTAQSLSDSIQTEAYVYTNEEGWETGWSMPIPEADNPFMSNAVDSMSTIAPDDEPLAIFDDTLELMAVDAPDTVIQDGWMPVTLYWRVRDTGRPVRDYFSRVQLWDVNQVSFGAERTAPMVMDAASVDFPLNIHFYIYPTVQWNAGEIIPDTRWIQVSPAMPAGAYRFAVGVYGYPGIVPMTNTALSQVEHWGLVGRTAIEPTFYMTDAQPPQTGLRLGDLYELVDYTVSSPVEDLSAGDTITVDIVWYVHETTERDFITAVHLTDSAGALVAQQDIPAFNGAFPTWAWQAGTQITLSYSLTIPEDAQAPFALNTLMYTLPDVSRLPASDSGESLLNDVIPIE
ncbi:MAG: hypothetical protein AAF126_11185 [Chloroflexota bacterium]